MALQKNRRMAKLPPAWQAHHATDYDSAMTARCTALLAQIISDPARRRDILADPRNLHHELLASFAPPGHDEYAGTYRGTPGTSLANRRIFSESLMEPAGQYEFCLPGQVPARINQLLEHTLAWLANTKADDYGKLLGLAYTFCWFGKIHPVPGRQRPCPARDLRSDGDRFRLPALSALRHSSAPV
jgi:hypothetical protein